MKETHECAAYVIRLAAPQPDLLSMLAHSESSGNMRPEEFLGNILLIVDGNDTSRNSMSGGVLALNEHPEEYHKLSADPAPVPSMVSEIIRWRTPSASASTAASATVWRRCSCACCEKTRSSAGQIRGRSSSSASRDGSSRPSSGATRNCRSASTPDGSAK